MILFQACIEVDHHAIKKNSRVILRNRATGRPFIGKGSELAKAEKHLTTALLCAKSKIPNFQTINQRVEITFKFYHDNFYTKKGVRSQKLGDLSNLYQLPEDCLVQAGILQDDGLIDSHDGSRILPGFQNLLQITIKTFPD